MASAICQLQQWSIYCHCGWFHQSVHVGREISSISQGQSIRQRSGEGETPTKGFLMFKLTLWKFQRRYGKHAKNCKILHSRAPHRRWGSVWLLEAQTWHAAWRQTRITHAKSSQLYLSTSWNKVLSSSSCWLFFDQHIWRVLFQPPGNGCNSSYTRQTATSIDIPTTYMKSAFPTPR
jgi:hypothetical protein